MLYVRIQKCPYSLLRALDNDLFKILSHLHHGMDFLLYFQSCSSCHHLSPYHKASSVIVSIDKNNYDP